jgi:hypothetical protein
VHLYGIGFGLDPGQTVISHLSSATSVGGSHAPQTATCLLWNSIIFAVIMFNESSTAKWTDLVGVSRHLAAHLASPRRGVKKRSFQFPLNRPP